MVIFHYHVGFSYLKQVIFQPVMLVFRGISVDFQGRPHDVNKKTLTGHTGSSDGRSVRWECTCTSAMGMGWQGGRRRGNFAFNGNLRIDPQRNKAWLFSHEMSFFRMRAVIVFFAGPHSLEERHLEVCPARIPVTFLENENLEVVNNMNSSVWNKCASLRITGPCNGRVWTCIAGFRVLKIAAFEGTGYLGLVSETVCYLFYPQQL